MGSNTAILSIVDAAWLRPLPFDEASALVSLWLEHPSEAPEERIPLTGADLADFRAEPGLFAALSGWMPTTPTLSGVGQAEVIAAAAVTEGMFGRVLRVRPLLGRTFLPEEDRPGASPTVVLSHAFWNDHFGGDAGAIGRSVVLDGEPHIVVGVMPSGFRPPFRSDAALWTPARLAGDRCRADCPAVPAIARLAPGTALSVARDRASALAVRLRESYPDTNTGITARMLELGRDRSRLSARTLRLLSAAGGLVLLIACVNVAMLLVARGVDRRREMSVRRSLGADATSIGRQLVGESVLLSAAGGLVGLAVASWGIEALLQMAPPELVGLDRVAISGRVLGMTALLIGGAGVLFGLGPALVVARDRSGSLLDPGRPLRRRPGVAGALGGGVVVVEIALAMTLAVGAGALLQGLRRATTPEPGFEPDRLLAMSVALPQERFPEPARRALLLRTLTEKLGELPGAFSVGATSALPLDRASAPLAMRIEDDPLPAAAQPRTVQLRRVSEGYFYTVGQRLAEGRGLRPRDDEQSDPVAILNLTAARRYFGDPPRSPVGARVSLEGSEPGTWRTVVGVVRDASVGSDDHPPDAVVYVPLSQAPPEAVTMVVRVDGDPEAVMDAARGVLAEVGPGLAAARVAPMEALVDEAYASERFAAALTTTFAVVALMLSMVGLYGIIAHAVASRVRELGLRRAVGATDDDLRRRVVGRALRFAAAGVLVGAVGSGLAARGLGAALGGVDIRSPIAYAVAVTCIGLAALAASAQPARRSIAIDPAVVLRTE